MISKGKLLKLKISITIYKTKFFETKTKKNLEDIFLQKLYKI